MKFLNPVLIATVVILIVLSCFMIVEHGGPNSRWDQILISSTFFILFLGFTRRRDFFLIVAFFLFVLSDVLLLFYEIPGFRKITSAVSILAYVFLIQHISPYIRKIRNEQWQSLMLISIFAINVLMLYLLIDMVESVLNDFLLIYLFYLYGFAMIFLVIIAFSYNNRYSNKASFYFVSAILALVLGEIASFIAYYVDVPIFYYPERIFYILGLFSLLKFSSSPKKEGILLNEDFF